MLAPRPGECDVALSFTQCRLPQIPRPTDEKMHVSLLAGACSEWLRKVAEVNSDLKIITFEDHDLEKVFVEPIG